MKVFSQNIFPLALALAALALNSSAAPQTQVGVFLKNAPMLTTRARHSATLLHNGKVLVVGGYGGESEGFPVLASAELYDPATGMWTATGSLNHARFSHTATLLADGKVLVVGGLASGGTTRGLHLLPAQAWEMSSDNIRGISPAISAELYDPATGKWAGTGAPNTVAFADTATLLPNGKVLLMGKAGFFDAPYSAEIYDPAAGNWTPASPPSTTFRWPTATLLRNGQVLVDGCGIGSAPAAIFNPASGKWSTITNSMIKVMQGVHTATLLLNGKVLVVGQSGGNARAFNTPIYDPATGTWSSAGAITGVRVNHTATLLADGTVLIVGGLEPSSGRGGTRNYSSAELFDPASGKWKQLANQMGTARYYHTATLLPNAKVLIAGGIGGGFTSLSSTELYDPEYDKVSRLR